MAKENYVVIGDPNKMDDTKLREQLIAKAEQMFRDAFPDNQNEREK